MWNLTHQWWYRTQMYSSIICAIWTDGIHIGIVKVIMHLERTGWDQDTFNKEQVLWILVLQYKSTSLYLPLTLMTKYKKSNANSQPIIVTLWTVDRKNKSQSITTIDWDHIEADSQCSCPHEFGDNQEDDSWNSYFWVGSFKNYTRPTDSSMWNLFIIKNENTHDSTEENGDSET